MDWLFGTRYKLWVINTKTEAKLYLWEKWRLILPHIDEIVRLAEYQAFIRTYQSFEYENRWLGFGRMKWNEENNLKWTTKYRTEKYSNSKIQFLGTEIWSPDWNQCCKTGETPKIFIKVYHYTNLDKLKEGILVAIPKRIANDNKLMIESNLGKIMIEIPNSTLSSVSRYWNPGFQFVNRIEDINNRELEKIIDKE